MSEDELDDLFRQAASGLHPEFDPEAWQAMEKKLDAAAGAPPTNWWRLGGLVILILFLVGISVWVGYNRLGREKETALNKAEEGSIVTMKENQAAWKRAAAPDAAASKTAAGKAAPAPAVTTKPSLPPISPAKVAPAAVVSRAQKAAPETQADVRLARSDRRRRTGGGTNSRMAPAAGNNNSDDPKGIAEAGTSGATGTAETAAVTNDFKEILPTTDSTAGRLASSATALATSSSQGRLAEAVTDSAGAKGAKKSSQPLALSKFTFSLMAAPDLSTVGFTNPGGISTNAGITIGYSLNNKWSLTTGIIKARKIYDAKPGDYGNKYFWNNRRQPDAISAVCRVLDIPVNVGYNIWQQEKSVLTVQTGLSSYFMLDEKYTYKYYGAYPYNKLWQVANQNRHLFSIYNLSASYARQLSPSLLVGAEPFVKVPLAGVGAGEVNLLSAGIFFSLSYRYLQ